MNNLPDIHINELTTADDWCQRLKENPSDPLEDIRQEHEGFLAELEALAVQALATGNWDKVFAHINEVRSAKFDLSSYFQSQEEHGEAIAFIQRLLGEASTKDLPRPGAGSFSQPTQQIDRSNSIMSSTINYVADHIDRIERRHGGQQSLILDSKWRIASAIDLFPYGILASDGTLTPEQIDQVDAYIARFAASPAGKEAIAQYQRRTA